jgi:hydrogenase maturation protease
MEASWQRPRIAVIGIGNPCRRDDAVGPAVVTALARHGERHPLPQGTGLFRCDGEPARLLDLWQGVRLAVVVDAAFGAPGQPGRVRRLGAEDVLRSGSGDPAGSHGFGLRTAIELAHALDRLPKRLVVYAVEGADATLGTCLSAPVRSAVRPLARRIADEITRCAVSPS